MSNRLYKAVVAVLCLLCWAAVIQAQDTEEGEVATGDTRQKKSAWKRMFGGAEGSAKSSSTPEVGVVAVEGAYTYSSATRQMQERLNKTQASTIPEVRTYMLLVDTGQARPRDLHAFAMLLAENGFLEVALVYSAESLRLDPDNAEYWTNHGTMARYTGDIKESIEANKKAIGIDPGLALAHYNLGVSYDARDKYDKAIEEYVKAFTLDPSLADPRVNPQVVNNFSFAAASLVLYERRGGHQVLPLIPLDETDPGQLPLRDDAHH